MKTRQKLDGIPVEQFELFNIPKAHFCAVCGRRIKRFGMGGKCKAVVDKSRISQVIKRYLEREGEL